MKKLHLKSIIAPQHPNKGTLNDGDKGWVGGYPLPSAAKGNVNVGETIIILIDERGSSRLVLGEITELKNVGHVQGWKPDALQIKYIQIGDRLPLAPGWKELTGIMAGAWYGEPIDEIKQYV